MGTSSERRWQSNPGLHGGKEGEGNRPMDPVSRRRSSRRRVHRVYSSVNREPSTGVEYTVPGLTDGKEYEFRVAAVNRAGPGEFGTIFIAERVISSSMLFL